MLSTVKNSTHLSDKSKIAAFVTALGIVSLSLTATAVAQTAPAGARNAAQDPQVKKFSAEAAAALKAGNLPLATIQLKNAIRLAPTDPNLRFQLGTVLLRSGDINSAERELRMARNNGAREQDVSPLLMQVLLQTKKTKDLLADFLDPAPGDKSELAAITLRARALAHQAQGNSAEAIASIDRALIIKRDVDTVLTRAQIAMLQSQPAEVMKYADQALAISPNNPNALMMKSTVLRFTDKNAAMAMLDNILKANPDYFNAIVGKIELLIEQGKNDEAQKNVNLITAKYPNAPIATFYNALLLGTRNQAKEGWRIAQSLPPEFIQSEARVAIGTAQLAAAAGNLESAHSIMTSFVSRNPTITESRIRLAGLRLRMKNAKGALESLAPLMTSQEPRTLELIAAAYQDLGQRDNAVLYLRKADAAGSQNGSVKQQLAMESLRRGDTAKGVQEMLGVIASQAGNLTGASAGVDFLLKQKKFAEAQTLANQADKVNPKSPVPLYLKGQVLYAQGKQAESLTMINQALQRDARYVPALFGRAQVYIAQRKFNEASADLKVVQTIEPNNVLAYAKLAEIADTNKQTAQAIAILKQGITKQPNHVPTRLLLARYQISLNQFAEASTTLKTGLASVPNDPQMLSMLATVQDKLGQKSAALATNKLLVQKYQQSGAAQYLLATSLLANGDKKSALAAMKRATELSPDVLQYRTALIALQIETGDPDGAVKTARGWEALHKGTDATILLAETLAKLKRLPEAAAVVERNKLNATDWRIAILESQIAMERGNQAQALAALKNWLAGHSTDITVRTSYASLLMRMNNEAEALAQYEIILKARNDIPEALNNTAWLVRDSNPARALALASKAWELAPNSPDIADTYGWLLLKKGDAKAAVPVLQRAHAIGPDNGEISYHLALALNATGKRAEAKSTLQAALAKGSNFPSAAEARKLMQQL